MLELARLTLTRPTTLLLDEPCVGLMPRWVDEVYAEIARLKEQRFPILIIGQNLRTAMKIADYVDVLNLGENSYSGLAETLRQRLEDIGREWL